jgi:hypothetical protein
VFFQGIYVRESSRQKEEKATQSEEEDERDATVDAHN